MPETNADIGFGVDLLEGQGDGPPETFVTLGVEITSISPPAFHRDSLEATHMKSPDSHREFVPGLSDAGEIQIEGNFVASASDLIVAAMAADTKSWRIAFPNAVTWTCQAFFTDFEAAAPIDGIQTFSATLKVTGKPVLA